MISLDFIITSFLVILIPGTGVLFTVSTGLMQGRTASAFAALGCTLGIVPHLIATILGLAAIMHTSALVFQAVKYAGVVYLFYIAVATWRDKKAFEMNKNCSELAASGLILKAIMLNILNPKLTIFFLAFLPQFIQPGHADPLFQMLLLSATFMIMTFLMFIVYGLLAHAFRKTVIESPDVQAWLRRGFAATFAGLGANLAFTEDR